MVISITGNNTHNCLGKEIHFEISLSKKGLFCPTIGNSLSKVSSSMLYIVVSVRPTESLLGFFFSAQVFGTVVGKSSVVVYRSLLLVSTQESVVREGMLRPQSSGRSVLDWEGGELLHCALSGNCNHTLSRSQPVT